MCACVCVYDDLAWYSISIAIHVQKEDTFIHIFILVYFQFTSAVQTVHRN
jgi:hypothetical protein